MYNKIIWSVVAGVVALSLVGCNGARELRKKLSSREAKLEECLSERRSLEEELKAQEEQMTGLDARLQDAQKDARELSELKTEMEDIANEREERVEKLRRLVADISGMSVESRSGEDFIVIENEILFPSGTIALTDDAKGALESVVEYLSEELADNGNLKVRVAGHTDGEPIEASDWEDNYHLAAMRAHSVMTFLKSKDIPAEKMFIVGYGPNRPRVEPPEATASVSENRRVEISILPENMASSQEMLEELAE